MASVTLQNYYDIVVAGDSISRGVVYSEEKNKYVISDVNYVNLLKNNIKGTVKNIAKFGNTLLKGIDTLKRYLSKDKPDIVVIEFGGNDCDFNWEEIAKNPHAEHRPKTDFYIFKEKLKELIKSLDDANIIPVLMTLPPLDADRYFKWISKNSEEMGKNILKWLGSVTKIYWWQEKYNSAILSIAEETKTRLIDIRSAFLDYPDFRQFICADGIHPNERGHKIIAHKVYEYLQRNYTHLLKE
ncbi:G-D-S-L family lipolytic protein [Caldanaerobacter subterraneus subsp. yonseiensis KB-1]|uniref:G-D-S-L family lipolytic protein n=1 Tax=Caldanaerobacter subterraneus subsp. yonseiensis KB-1 TaxID=1388761 RepID=U5CQI6_CALSX|nr:SGNH/GDSL hydrolase family protein [Caldanaerobacter subterraneus]ERM91216.1 G-D-S-L family lipolytic protein [Caldanaerobacter subterraneus subsp. yonseiensis KB-1]